MKAKDRWRVKDHPILGKRDTGRKVTISVDGKEMQAFEEEPIAAALMANGIRVFRKTRKRGEPRGVFCAIGRCTDCIMTVDGVPNVRTCMALVKEGMQIKSERG
ncbi:MAG: (2Fe-2S)-binding protein [Thermodesulfobacteriota bacterium]|nr:(2Fe-2S)-binding protein [Thermodesulfobacteriota bacterium]